MVIIKISILLAFTLTDTPLEPANKCSKKSLNKKASKKDVENESKKPAKGKKVKEKPVKETPVIELPKHVFEIAKPIRSVHIEYELIPGRPKYQVDVLCWGDIAKIFSADGDLAIKCYVKNKIAWVPISLRHVINQFSDEEIIKLHEHVIDYYLITNPAKLGKSARTDKSKVYFIKECDIDSTEKFTLAYPTDPNINPVEENPIEQDIRNFIWECSDSPGLQFPEEIVSRLQFLQDPLHKYIINKTVDQIIDKKKVESKDFVTICPPPVTDVSAEEETQLPTSKEKKKGKKDKNSNKTGEKKDKGAKGKPIEGLKISVPGEVFYTDPNLNIYKLKMPSTEIYQAFIITTASSILTKQQKYRLNPLIIKIEKISNFPVEILRQHRFKNIYAYFSVPYIAQCTTIKKPIESQIKFNEGHAYFLHNVPKIKLVEFMQTQRLVVEIVGERDRLQILNPSLFGCEEEDKTISKLVNTITSTRILQQPLSEPTMVTLAVACFNISSLLAPVWDFKETASCHHPNSMLFQKYAKRDNSLEFIDTFNINEINLEDAVKCKSWNPLTEEVLTALGTSLSIEVYLSSPFRGVLEIFTNPNVYNRLLFVANDMKVAKYFFQLIMLHNQHILGPEVILTNYIRGGIKQNDIIERRVTIDYSNLKSVITGFILNNSKSYTFFIEGLFNELITHIWAQIQDTKRSLMKIFYNSNYIFENRIYPEFIKFGGVYVINLSVPLFDILNQDLFYLEGNVPTPCWKALKKFDLMFHSRSFEVMHQCDLFPTAKELFSLDMEYGVPYKWTEDNHGGK